MEMTTKPKYIPNAKLLLNGQSPHARGWEKKRKVLDWIYRHGYSTADIIRQVAGQKAPGYSKKLKEAGLIVETRTTVAEIPKFFYTLSKAGLEIAERYAENLLNYRFMEPYKLSQAQFRHNFTAQKLTADALAAKVAHEYTTPMMAASKNMPDQKKPDACWQDCEGNWIAVEVEFTQKFGTELFQMFDAMVTSLLNETFKAYFIYSDSMPILKKYLAAMQSVEEKSKDKSTWLIARTYFILLEGKKEFEDPRLGGGPSVLGKVGDKIYDLSFSL